jgi:hypothetical protein
MNDRSLRYAICTLFLFASNAALNAAYISVPDSPEGFVRFDGYIDTAPGFEEAIGTHVFVWAAYRLTDWDGVTSLIIGSPRGGPSLCPDTATNCLLTSDAKPFGYEDFIGFTIANHQLLSLIAVGGFQGAGWDATTSRFFAYTLCPIEPGVEHGSTFGCEEPKHGDYQFSGPVTSFEMVPAPEPSAAVLLMVGAVSLSVMRRYRR